jgi:ATP-dependent DNA ligase
LDRGLLHPVSVRNRSADAVHLVAFDLLHIDGEDRRKPPWRGIVSKRLGGPYY